MSRKYIQIATILILLGAMLVPATAQQPWRIYSLFSSDVYEGVALFSVDDSLSIPLSRQCMLSVGGLWKAELSENFFSLPSKTEARIGGILIVSVWNMYFEAYSGMQWSPNTSGLSLWDSATTTTFAEVAANWETDHFYFGLRERLLFNAVSTTSITNLLWFWTPQPFMKLSLGASIGLENEVPALPGIRAEFLAPLIVSRPELFRAGVGISYERFFEESLNIAGNTYTIKAILASEPAPFLDIKVSCSWNFGDRETYPLQLEMLSTLIIK